MGAFVNQGGAIQGNAPVLIGGNQPPGSSGKDWLRIDLIALDNPRVGPAAANPDLHPEIVLYWNGPGDRRFEMETSDDFHLWHVAPILIREITYGR